MILASPLQQVQNVAFWRAPVTIAVMTQPYTGRFAPSPSGPLHMGSLLAAVISWLDARHHDGRWLVRMEDLDPPREVPGAADAILRALEAHGLYWEGSVLYQSSRDPAYEAALTRLQQAGLLFRCTCTRRQLRAAGGIYPGTCRARGMCLPQPDQGHTIRVRVPPAGGAPTVTRDRLQAPLSQDLATEVGDFILRRRDGYWAYQLAVVVDDADQGITDVVRGVDLLVSTPRQQYLQQCLDLPTPRYLHLPVLVDARGDKLSKQTGAPGLELEQARANLARVLGWLGLPVLPGAAVDEQLRLALTRYRPEALPRQQIRLPTNADRAGIDP